MREKWLVVTFVVTTLLFFLPACSNTGGGGDSGQPVVRKDGKTEMTTKQETGEPRPTFKPGFYEKNITNAIASVTGALQDIGRKTEKEIGRAQKDFGYLKKECLDFRSEMDAEKGKGGSHENQR